METNNFSTSFEEEAAAVTMAMVMMLTSKADKETDEKSVEKTMKTFAKMTTGYIDLVMDESQSKNPNGEMVDDHLNKYIYFICEDLGIKLKPDTIRFLKAQVNSILGSYLRGEGVI